MRGRRLSAVVLATGLAGCGGGGGSPTRPEAAPPASTGLASGATLTVLSGADGAALPGATLSVGGQTITSDASGQVRIGAPASFGTLLDVTHPAHLDRQSTVRTDTGTRLTLWPRTTPDGLDENYTATLVYTEAADDPPAVGTSPLYRLPPGAETIVIVPSAQLLADGPAMEAHQAAANDATSATGGRVRVLLAQSAANVGTGIVVTTRVDPGDAQCSERNLRGYMRGTYGNFVVVSGEIVFCSLSVARSATVTHELGHAFGLNHAPAGSNDIMAGTFSNRRSTTFGPRESLVLRLMLDRTPGQRYPDNDRGVGRASVREQRLTVCH